MTKCPAGKFPGVITGAFIDVLAGMDMLVDVDESAEDVLTVSATDMTEETVCSDAGKDVPNDTEHFKDADVTTKDADETKDAVIGSCGVVVICTNAGNSVLVTIGAVVIIVGNSEPGITNGDGVIDVT